MSDLTPVQLDDIRDLDTVAQTQREDENAPYLDTVERLAGHVPALIDELYAINRTLRENGVTYGRAGVTTLGNNYAAAREARNQAEEQLAAVATETEQLRGRFERSQADLGEALATVEKLKTGVARQRETIDALGNIAFDELWGERFPHRGHENTSGGPDCAGCWADMILQAIGEEPKDEALAATFKEATENLNASPDVQEPVNTDALAPLTDEDLTGLRKDQQRLAKGGRLGLTAQGMGRLLDEVDRLREALEAKSVVHQCCEDLQDLRAANAAEEPLDVPGPRQAIRDALPTALRALSAWPFHANEQGVQAHRILARLHRDLTEPERPAVGDRPAGPHSAPRIMFDRASSQRLTEALADVDMDALRASIRAAGTHLREAMRPAVVSIQEQAQAWLHEFQDALAEAAEPTLRDVMAAAYRNGRGLSKRIDQTDEDSDGRQWRLREWDITNRHHRVLGSLELEQGPNGTHARLTSRGNPESEKQLYTNPTPGVLLDAARAAGLITK